MNQRAELKGMLGSSVRALLNTRSCSTVYLGAPAIPCASLPSSLADNEPEDGVSQSQFEDVPSGSGSPRADAWEIAGHDPRYRELAVLAPREERRLIAMAKAGDSFSVEKLALHHLPLLRSVARRYINCGLSRGELVDEGIFGIVRAVERFDPARSVRFATYARWWIRDAMRKALLSQARLIRLPAHPKQHFGAKSDDKSIDNSERPSVIDCGESTLVDEVPDLDTPDSTLHQKQLMTALQKALESLDEREREVLDGRFGLRSDEEVTLSWLANRLGVSCERVRQIQNSALLKLRTCIEAGAAHG